MCSFEVKTNGFKALTTIRLSENGNPRKSVTGLGSTKSLEKLGEGIGNTEEHLTEVKA